MVPLPSTGTKVDVVLDSTPFYAESGGQSADRGLLCGAQGLPTNGSNGASAPSPNQLADPVLLVGDVQKAAGGQLFVHKSEVQRGTVRIGDQVGCCKTCPLFGGGTG